MSAPAVAVVYGFGAASPLQIAQAARGLTDVVFVLDGDDEHTNAVRGLLPGLGARVLDIGGGVSEVAARLRGTVAGITTFSDARIDFTSRLARELGLPYHDESTARLLTDKHRQRSALNAVLPRPTPTAVVRSADDLAMLSTTVGFPLVLKPRSGTAGAFTYQCDDPDDCGRLLRRLFADGGTGRRTWVAEALLRRGRHPAGDWLADYVSVESVVCGDDIHHFAITDKLPLAPPFRETGMVTPTALGPADRDAVHRLTTSALRALGVRHGVTHTEVKLSPDGPRVIEVNGRLGGRVGRLIDRASDLNPVRLALQNALGVPVGRPDPAFSKAALVYGALPPPRRVSVRAAPTMRGLRQVDGVWKLDRMAERGETLDWELGSGQRVCDVWAETSSLSTVPALLGQLAGAVDSAVAFEPV